MKVLCWGYSIAGIGGANSTGPSHEGAPAEFGESCALFDLGVDAGEHNNIAKTSPDQLDTLLARLKVSGYIGMVIARRCKNVNVCTLN